MIIASDGLWNTVTNEKAAEKLMKAEQFFRGDMYKAAWELTSYSFNKGSSDNITVAVVDLKAAALNGSF